MNATLSTLEIENIATELKIMYGSKPAMEIIDLARSQNVLKARGVVNIVDVFAIAKSLNKLVA